MATLRANVLACSALRARPTDVDGVVEEIEPALGVSACEGPFGVHELVHAVGVPVVDGHRQQRPAPERGELGEVRRPVDVGHVVEDGAEQIVLGHVDDRPGAPSRRSRSDRRGRGVGVWTSPPSLSHGSDTGARCNGNLRPIRTTRDRALITCAADPRGPIVRPSSVPLAPRCAPAARGAPAPPVRPERWQRARGPCQRGHAAINRRCTRDRRDPAGAPGRTTRCAAHRGPCAPTRSPPGALDPTHDHPVPADARAVAGGGAGGARCAVLARSTTRALLTTHRRARDRHHARKEEETPAHVRSVHPHRRRRRGR